MNQPKTELCNECGGQIAIGDFPFCFGNPDAHQPTRPSSAFFAPITVYRDKKGRIRVPGRSDGKVPKGWDKVEINTRREADKLSKEMSSRDYTKWHDLRTREEAFFEKNLSRNRDEILKLREGADGHVRQFIDDAIRSSDEKDRRARSYDPGIYWKVLE